MEFETVIKSIIYLLFNIVGASRQEILNIKVTDVPCHISKNQSFYITLRSDKKYRGRSTDRILPIDLSVISELRVFIDCYRRRVLLDTISQKNDHGYLLVSKVSGERLSLKSLSHNIRGLQNDGAIQNTRLKFSANYFKQLTMDIIDHNKNITYDGNSSPVDIGLIVATLEKNTTNLSQKTLKRYISAALKEM